jgi:hypothetical protein
MPFGSFPIVPSRADAVRLLRRGSMRSRSALRNIDRHDYCRTIYGEGGVVCHVTV